jgi:hypothetical protein
MRFISIGLGTRVTQALTPLAIKSAGSDIARRRGAAARTPLFNEASFRKSLIPIALGGIDDQPTLLVD